MSRMNQGFSLCRVSRYFLVAGLFAAAAFASARAACPDVSSSYSPNLFNTVTKGVALANAACATEGEPHGGSCNSFVGMALEKAYGQPDLTTTGGYLSIVQLHAYLPASTTWTFMAPRRAKTCSTRHRTTPIMARRSLHFQPITRRCFSQARS